MYKLVKFLILCVQNWFGYESTSVLAHRAYDIYHALRTNDISVLNKYCKSKQTIEILSYRIYDIHFYRSNVFTYTYDEKHFNSIDMLDELCKNKDAVHISEFVALYFYLKSSMRMGSYPLSSIEIWRGRERDIYMGFLDKV